MAQNEKNIYDLELHETCKIKIAVGVLSSIEYTITRVPGGWIYLSTTVNGISTIFVPYSKEFNKIPTLGEAFK